MAITLGLDLGVTSIGWALLNVKYENQKQIVGEEIIASGVRIFPATTEAKTKEPKNFKRRTSRGGRRLLNRRAGRKEKLRNLLIESNLLPQFNGETSGKYFDKLGDPYELRVKALNEKLKPFEIGRAIYHLEKRRGFKSNRKSGDAKEEGKVLGSIKELRETIEEKNYESLGEFLVGQDKKRGRYISRKMVENEFEKIWETQRKFYPEVLTDEIKTEIKQSIFFQRPMKLQRHLTGKCTFETDKKRCDMARQPAQRIRFWQDINNLKLQDEDSIDWLELNDEERQKVADELEKKKQLSFKQIRKVLKINDTVLINLEANVKNIKGNTTAYEMRKAIGKTWDELDEEKQERLVEEMFRIESPESLKKRLKEFWEFNEKQTEKLLKAPLEGKYSRLSLKAINKVLPKMIDNGLRYDEVVIEVYGDHRKLFDTENLDELPEPPKDLRNPIVTKALHELRKVVNAIIRKYGKPDEIRVELARDLKMNEKQKTRVIQQQNKNKTANEEAADFYAKKFGVEKVSYDDKLKYRLWMEAGENCPYTGQKIPPELLLTDKVDIEHIIPYSRSFDNSYMNKTICMSGFNRDTKKNQTPFEVFGENEEKYFEILKRTESMPWAKRRRFEQKELDEDKMIGRQLSDTRYISTEARKYLLKLYETEQKVSVLPGQATAGLRHHWGMNAILSEGDIDLKNRDDHRHHAIDAIVVALTNRSLFQYISRLSNRNRANLRKDLKGIEMPWESFLDDVSESMDNITVSHAPMRRVRGKLLKETAYGATREDEVFVTRKSISELTKAMIPKIVDEMIRQIIETRLAECDGNMKKAFGTASDLIDENGKPFVWHKNGETKIKKVRIYETMQEGTYVGITDDNGEVYKYYASGGNHHVEIYENMQTEERKAVLVSRFAAAANIRKSIKNGKTPSYISNGLGEYWHFLFSLCKNDYIEVIGDGDELSIYRVQKMSGGKGFEITLRGLNDRFKDIKQGNPLRLRSKSSLLKITRKLQVDSLGHLTQAND